MSPPDDSESSDIDRVIEAQMQRNSARDLDEEDQQAKQFLPSISSMDPSYKSRSINRTNLNQSRKKTTQGPARLPQREFAPGEFGFTVEPEKLPSLKPLRTMRASGDLVNLKNPFDFTDGDNGERIMKIHQQNVANYPNLYQERTTAPEMVFVGERGGINLFKDDVAKLQQKGEVTEHSINYFMKYLQDKQAKLDSAVLDKYCLKAYFFTTEFYRDYVTNLEKKFFTTKYERVKHITNLYKGEGKTIFDQFQKIVFPIPVLEDSNKLSFKVIIADSIRKELTLYDPKRNLNNDYVRTQNPREDKHLSSIASYIEQEYGDKSYLNIDVASKWRILFGECTQTENREMSGLYICYYVYTILKGVRQPFFSTTEISKFHKKMKGMFSSLTKA